MHVLPTILFFLAFDPTACKILVPIHYSSHGGKTLRHFWTSTGFTAPEDVDRKQFLLSDDVFKNLAIIGSLPSKAIEQVRIHWLLDLVRMRNPVDNPLDLDFSDLDRLVHHLWLFDLKPGFELMGNPSGFFDDFENPMQVMVWRDLIRLLAKHYVDRYGISEVSKWNFESWNEPDHRDFGNLNFTTESFSAYYDATSEGLKAAHPNLRFGGPGGSCRPPHFIEFCHSLLQHSVNGTNFFTGELGVRLDFVSVHKKGQEDSKSIIDGEMDTIKDIRENYPGLGDKPLFNDEGDPMKSWWKERSWRGDVTYPALVAETIIGNIKYVIGDLGVDLELFSNDNAFLNVPPAHFDQRTLLTRFTCQPEIGDQESQFVQKPIFNLMAMLSMLGDRTLQAEARADNVSVLATKSVDDDESLRTVSVLLVNRNDTEKKVLNVAFNFLPDFRVDNREPKYFTYKLDDVNTNPRRLWQSMGSPSCPTREEISKLRLESRLKRSPIQPLNQLHFGLTMPSPSVKLLQICYPLKDDLPTQPTRLTFFREARNVSLVTWRYLGSEECLRGFSVEYSEGGDAFEVVNEGEETIFRFLHFEERREEGGWFRVRALDVWDRYGPYSVSVQQSWN